MYFFDSFQISVLKRGSSDIKPFKSDALSIYYFYGYVSFCLESPQMIY